MDSGGLLRLRVWRVQVNLWSCSDLAILLHGEMQWLSNRFLCMRLVVFQELV